MSRPESQHPPNPKWAGMIPFIFMVLLGCIILLACDGAPDRSETQSVPSVASEPTLLGKLPQDNPHMIREPALKLILTAIGERQQPGTVLSELRPLFQAWVSKYQGLLDRIEGKGYRFKSLDRFTVGDVEKPIAFLTFSLRLQDLLPALGIMDVNIRRHVPAVYYIPWDRDAQVREFHPLLVNLKRLDPDRVNFGLLCMPAADWVTAELCGDNPNKYGQWLNEKNLTRLMEDPTQFKDDWTAFGEISRLAEILEEMEQSDPRTPADKRTEEVLSVLHLALHSDAARRRHPYRFENIRQTLQDRFRQRAADFAIHFPMVRSIAASGGIISQKAVDTCFREIPGLADQWPQLDEDPLPPPLGELCQAHVQTCLRWRALAAPGVITPRLIQDAGYLIELWNFQQVAPVNCISDGQPFGHQASQLDEFLDQGRPLIIYLTPFNVYDAEWLSPLRLMDAS